MSQFSPKALRNEIMELLILQGLSKIHASKLAREVVTKAKKIVRETKPMAAVTIEDSFALDQKIQIQIRTSCDREPKDVLARYLMDRRIVSKTKYPDVDDFRISEAFGHEGLPVRVYIARLLKPDEKVRLREVNDLVELLSQDEANAILSRLADRPPPEKG